MRPPWGDAVGHHALVEFAQAEPLALRLLIIRAQLEGCQLAKEVAAIGRIVGATFRFLSRGRRRQMRLVLEELRRLIDGPLARVETNPGDEPADARERLTDL